MWIRDWGAQVRRKAWDGALVGLLVGTVLVGAVFGDRLEEASRPAADLLLLIAVYGPGPAVGALVGGLIGLRRQCGACRGYGRKFGETAVCESCGGTGHRGRDHTA